MYTGVRRVTAEEKDMREKGALKTISQKSDKYIKLKSTGIFSR